MLYFLGYLLVGAFAGLLAGLFGVGGGTVIVPMLLLLLPVSGVPDAQVMTTALGTSFATIVLTSLSSALRHHKYGNVNWCVFRYFVPMLMLSVFISGWFVSYLPKNLLVNIFALMMLFLSLKMMLDKRDAGEAKPLTVPVQLVSGSIIGMLSSFAGIGGGAFIVPFLNGRGFVMKQAIGTSSACGVMLGLGATISFMLSGQRIENMPDFSIGFVYLPAFFGIAAASMFTSKIGANLANNLPVGTLKKAFASFLCVVAVVMLLK